MLKMGSEADRGYAVFESKVRRTVYLDNLSPQVTEAVIKSAIEPYGAVIKVQFTPNYIEPYLKSHSALVEMEKSKQAAYVVQFVNSYPFMILGMPRPVRARHAEAEMFEDRPPKPGRKIKLCWLDPHHRDFEVARKLKKMARKHQAESAYLLKRQWEEEEKLSKTQAETLKKLYKQHELMQKNLDEGSLNNLLQHYRLFADNPGNSNALCNFQPTEKMKKD